MMQFFTERYSFYRIYFSVSQSLKRSQDYFVDSGAYLRIHCLLLLTTVYPQCPYVNVKELVH